MTYQDEKEYQELKEKRTGTQLIRQGKILEMRLDEVETPGGAAAQRELVRHLGAVCVVALTKAGEIVLERQYRYPIDQVLTEIPAGKLDYAGEDPLAAAQRELREETGFRARQWTPLGHFYPAGAYSDEKIHMYLATDLEPGERDLDPDENIRVFTMPLEEAVRAVMQGEIPDAKTQLGILKAFRMMHGE